MTNRDRIEAAVYCAAIVGFGLMPFGHHPWWSLLWWVFPGCN